MIIESNRCKLPAFPVEQCNAQAFFQPSYMAANYGMAYAKRLCCSPDTTQATHRLEGFEC